MACRRGQRRPYGGFGRGDSGLGRRALVRHTGWVRGGNGREVLLDGRRGAALRGNQRDDLDGRDVGGQLDGGQALRTGLAPGLQPHLHQRAGRLDVVVIGGLAGAAVRVGGVPA
ncbi:hypothetical protein AB0395_42185 [Streptosporangium sp. NPDC051023]|uniref:hypothetical protein n=1 Tax=Streptosporangium sp. NPDC051023 TaxID=3155410 RepID=UPI00344D8EF4